MKAKGETFQDAVERLRVSNGAEGMSRIDDILDPKDTKAAIDAMNHTLLKLPTYEDCDVVIRGMSAIRKESFADGWQAGFSECLLRYPRRDRRTKS